MIGHEPDGGWDVVGDHEALDPRGGRRTQGTKFGAPSQIFGTAAVKRGFQVVIGVHRGIFAYLAIDYAARSNIDAERAITNKKKLKVVSVTGEYP